MACRLPCKIWMRRLFGKATKRRISLKGETTGVTTRIVTALMPITQDQFQFGVRNKAGYILYIIMIREVQVRGLEFDSGLWFSFCLIEILSITGQKFSKCLKNGSDLLRKGTTASTSLFVKLPINAMRTFNLWYPWSRIASGQSFKIVAGSSIFSSSLLACSRRSDSRAREKAPPSPARFPPFSRCTIQLAPHHLTAELYYLKAWNRLLSPNQRGQASMRLSEKGLISLPASHVVHSWEKSRDGLPATVASFPLQTIERTQTSSKNTESLTTITNILVRRVLVKA